MLSRLSAANSHDRLIEEPDNGGPDKQGCTVLTVSPLNKEALLGMSTKFSTMLWCNNCFLKKFICIVAVFKICCFYFLFLKFSRRHCRFLNYVEVMKTKGEAVHSLINTMKLLAIIFFISQCRMGQHDLNRWTLNSNFRSGHWAQRVVPLLVITDTLWFCIAFRRSFAALVTGDS